jgi:hypothetical protein
MGWGRWREGATGLFVFGAVGRLPSSDWPSSRHLFLVLIQASCRLV